MDCFDKMEKIMKICEQFTEKVNCDLGATAKVCEKYKVVLIKHCSYKECAGDLCIFVSLSVSVECR